MAARHEVKELADRLHDMANVALHAAREQVEPSESWRFAGRAEALLDAADMAMQLALKMQDKDLS